MQVRPAALDDAEAIAAIYNLEVVETTATFDLEPRSIQAQREWLQARTGAHVVLVAVTKSDGLLGFASLSPYKDRPAYSTTVESSVYVRRDARGRGVAKALIAGTDFDGPLSWVPRHDRPSRRQSGIVACTSSRARFSVGGHRARSWP